MKNIRGYVIGVIVGVVLTVSGQAFAGSVSLVGKKITDENVVIVNGEELDVKAVNINGTTYTPNRALANELGLDIEFKNNTIYFSDKEDAVVETTETPTSQGQSIDDQIAEIDSKIFQITKTERKPFTDRAETLRIEWESATLDRRLEIEAELKQIELDVKPINDKIDELFRQKNELLSQRDN